MDGLLPCPFCGNTDVRFDEQKYWTGQRNETIAVEIRHWCLRTDTHPLQQMVSRKAKTREAAIEAWNTREGVIQ